MAEAERLPGPDAIAQFWEWWSDTRDPLAEAIGRFRSEAYLDPLRDRLSELHPDLDFSLHPGLESAHGLSISGSTPEAERVAHSLLDSAPEQDEQWEYGNLILPPAVPEALTCLVGDLEISMAGMLAGVERFPATESVVVEFFHPLLVGLDWELAEEVLHHAAAAVRSAEPKRTRVVVTRAERQPENALKLSDLRLLLRGLD